MCSVTLRGAGVVPDRGLQVPSQALEAAGLSE